MKVKPRVDSKKAAFTVRVPAFKEGDNVAVPANLAGARGVPGLDVGSAIVKVEPAYNRGYVPGSGAPSGRTFILIDGGHTFGVGKGKDRAGGTLALIGVFTPGKIGSNGTIRTGIAVGYVTDTTGVFARAGLCQGDQFTALLKEGGRVWQLWIPSG